MNKIKRITIGKRLRSISLLVIILMCLCIWLFSFGFYAYDKIHGYQSHLGDLLNLVMTELDGDDLAECISTGVKSPHYEKMQNLLDRVKENFSIEYIYILRPLNTSPRDNIMNVMAGITAEEKRIDEEYYSVTLGELTGTDYSPQVAGKYLTGMSANKITYFENKTEFGWEYTAMIPIRTSSGEAVAVLAADVSMNDLIAAMIRYIIILLLVILVISAVVVFAMTGWLRRHVVHPLEQLKDSAENFVTASRATKDPRKLSLTKPDVHTGDEMEVLSDAMGDMYADIRRSMIDLVDMNREKGRISAELNVATQIQADILPSIFPIFSDRHDMNLYAYMHPAKEVGGDFYDFFLVDDNHLAMVMADVSGKGVPAALFMVIAKTLIKNQVMSGDSPSVVLTKVNEQLLEKNTAMLFVTVWLAIVDLSTGKGVAVNAGHEHPAIRPKDGIYALSVYRHAPPVSVMEGIRFREHTFELHPGDSLFVYTDGVTEATDSHGGLFGTDRLTEALNRDPGSDPEKQIAAVRDAIDAFVDGAPSLTISPCSASVITEGRSRHIDIAAAFSRRFFIAGINILRPCENRLP